MEIFLLPRDGKGEYFGQGNRYVCFANGSLVGEYKTRTQAERGFLSKERVEGGIEKKDYLGISENLRTYLWAP
jgi:hypothetical protein